MGLQDILKQLTGGQGDEQHFDQVARESKPDDFGAGIADAFRSKEAEGFGPMVANLFGKSNPNQRADMLNQLIAAVGPAVLGGAAGGGLGKILADLGLGGQQQGSRSDLPQGQGGMVGSQGEAQAMQQDGDAGQSLPRITPEQAAQIRPEDVGDLAHRAGQQQPELMDRMGRFYADHPDLVRGLGLVAITVAMNTLRKRMQR